MAVQTELKSIRVNGTELHYLEQGAGEPLVLVHGSLSDFRSWMLQVEAFSAQYRVIAYSRRYHYPNTWPEDGPEYSVELHAADLAALIEALGLGPARLVGHSFGAMTSLLAALHHPELVSRLVLAEPPILPWLERLPDGAPLQAAFVADTLEPALRAFESGKMELGLQTFIDGVAGRGAYERIPPVMHALQMDNARELKAEMEAWGRHGMRRGYFADPSCASLGRLRIPALLMGAERSPIWFHLILDELERCLPQARRVSIPNASHSMASGNPPAFNDAVLSFLF